MAHATLQRETVHFELEIGQPLHLKGVTVRYGGIADRYFAAGSAAPTVFSIVLNVERISAHGICAVPEYYTLRANPGCEPDDGSPRPSVQKRIRIYAEHDGKPMTHLLVILSACDERLSVDVVNPRSLR